MTGKVSGSRLLWTGLGTGFLLNLTGWLGNNFLLGGWWREVGERLALATFGLVLATKLPLALLAGWMVE